MASPGPVTLDIDGVVGAWGCAKFEEALATFGTLKAATTMAPVRVLVRRLARLICDAFMTFILWRVRQMSDVVLR